MLKDYENFVEEYEAPSDLLEMIMSGCFDIDPVEWASVNPHYQADVVNGFVGTPGEWAAKKLREGKYVLLSIEDVEEPYDLLLSDLVQGMTQMLEETDLDVCYWEPEDHKLVLQYTVFNEIVYEEDE